MNQQQLAKLSAQMSHLTEEQKMLHIAMFMDPKMIPDTPKSGNVDELSQTIKQLFKEKKSSVVGESSPSIVVDFSL